MQMEELDVSRGGRGVMRSQGGRGLARRRAKEDEEVSQEVGERQKG